MKFSITSHLILTLSACIYMYYVHNIRFSIGKTKSLLFSLVKCMLFAVYLGDGYPCERMSTSITSSYFNAFCYLFYVYGGL